MNTSSRPPRTPAAAEALEARFALRVTSRLDEGATALPHDIGERLRVARQQAVALARQQQAVATAPTTAPPVTVVHTQPAWAGAGGPVTAGLGSLPAPLRPHVRHATRPGTDGRLDEPPPSWGWRLASALPMLALVAGLWMVGEFSQREQVRAATEVDMALLTDELPPSAYADPGFEEFLRSGVDLPPQDTPAGEAPMAAEADLSDPAVEADPDEPRAP